jgi:hypothetical protein
MGDDNQTPRDFAKLYENVEKMDGSNIEEEIPEVEEHDEESGAQLDQEVSDDDIMKLVLVDGAGSTVKEMIHLDNV